MLLNEYLLAMRAISMSWAKSAAGELIVLSSGGLRGSLLKIELHKYNRVLTERTVPRGSDGIQQVSLRVTLWDFHLIFLQLYDHLEVERTLS